jgi:hypothetical protein
MNTYKLRAIVDHVRSHGRLPTDQWGNVLEPEDLLVWYGLDRVLSVEEQTIVKWELQAMIDAEEMMGQLRRMAS